MGETTIEISRVRAVVEEVLKDLEKDFKIEAEVIFGSWCRSGGEAWSDIDVLIVSDSILAAHFRSKRVDLFLYTFEEVERMALGEPLALSALIEGIPIRMSDRVTRLANYVKKCFVKRSCMDTRLLNRYAHP